MSQRHWCHQCRKEVGLLGNDLVCASCGSEFLEAIEGELIVQKVLIFPRGTASS